MTTNTRGSKIANIIKHPFAHSGRVYSDKRKHSEEEEEERKRDRKNSTDSPDTSLDDSQDLIVFDSSLNKEPDMTKDDDIKRMLVAALKDQEVAEVLTKTFDKSARKIVETLQTRVESIEEREQERDTDIADLKLRLDMVEMKERDKNIIVTGLPSDC